MTISSDQPYEMIDHTADIGIRVRGESLQRLFENAAFALFHSLAELDNVNEKFREEIVLTGMDLPELMVNWLNQLLYLWESKLVLFKRFQIEEITDTSLLGHAWGEPYQEARHELLTDIKAATYHGLSVEENSGIWTSEIVFDT